MRSISTMCPSRCVHGPWHKGWGPAPQAKATAVGPRPLHWAAAASCRGSTGVVYLLQAIGKGAYGVVCSAKNTVTGDKVAIKKIGNAFENLTDARRTLREIKLLRHLRHENIIGVRDIMRANRDRFNDVYLVRNARGCCIAFC